MNNAIPEWRLGNTITGELAQVGPVRGELRIAQAKLLAEEIRERFVALRELALATAAEAGEGA